MHRSMIAIAILALVAGCSMEPGSESWCESMEDRSKSEWSAEDAVTYAKHCVLESQTIGSKAWCEKLEERPKADWSASEAADYARHCVM